MNFSSQKRCTLCPRGCAIDRTELHGACGMTSELVVSRAAPHMWEEPPISGTRGSGTIFFAGCSLRCVFCQNRTISHERAGKPMTPDQLAATMLNLQNAGVHNVNLVTPTHYADTVAGVLEAVKPRLHIPVVWNTSGYETVDTLRRLEGLVDIYLPDFKYASEELAARYSAAPDYPTVAATAIAEMFRQVGPATFDADGMMTRGVIVRHLVLPGHRSDSMAVLCRIAEILPTEDIRISVMRQYTPDFATDAPYKNLHRRVTDFEYASVVAEAERLGLVGYMQGKDAADRAYTPDFNADL